MLVVIQTEKLLFVCQFYLVVSRCVCISKRSVFTAQVALANKQNPKPCQPKACCLLICSQLRSLLWRLCIEDSKVSLKVWTADQRNDKQIWKPISSRNEQKFCISNQKMSYHLMSDTPWIHTNQSNMVLALKQAKMSEDERTWNSVPTLLPTANQGSNSTWEVSLENDQESSSFTCTGWNEMPISVYKNHLEKHQKLKYSKFWFLIVTPLSLPSSNLLSIWYSSS